MATLEETKRKIQQAASTPAATALPVSAVNKQTQQIAQSMQGYQPKAQADPYTGLQGVNKNTAQQLGNLQQGYQQGDAVTNAQQQLAQIQAQKPQGYTSKYGEQLEGLLQQIQNPEKFTYNFNGDEIFKQYADRYTQQGKQAAMNAMGQAAALTGGYGNSYAQQAANQANQQWLLGLYDKGQELQQAAWDRYKYGQQQKLDQYGLLQQADATDYDRYLDQYNQWTGERDYATNRADTEYNRDYGQYQDQLSYWTQMAGAENADYNTQQQMAEQKRQWDEQFNYQKMSDDRKYAYDQATAILANGKLPTDTLLKAAGISKTDAKRMMKQAKTGGGGGGGRTTTPTTPAQQPGTVTTDEAQTLIDTYLQAYIAGQEKLKKVKPTQSGGGKDLNFKNKQTK